ncbi:hypothetical protein AGDE_03860 [Angomonas deanei]|nr:hypothetical protein AGDE_03860 [Angomonas deanei]|eukprot:EPY40068.1 hypothetical protein AGDE_03860 [Angomonas deanei]
MERAAAARREIYSLWSSTSDAPQDGTRLEGVTGIISKYKLDVTTPREDDICHGLGDALDRLLLLCVPLGEAGNTELLERVLELAARQGRSLSIRTVQHLFARTSSFPEALGIFYALRKSHVAMNVECYHAMLYSLQRLEEEGWGQRFNEEFEAKDRSEVSEKALEFVLRGVDNQLIPENKPWLGRLMFADADNTAAVKQTRESYDSLNRAWVNRYKNPSAM